MVHGGGSCGGGYSGGGGFSGGGFYYGGSHYHAERRTRRCCAACCAGIGVCVCCVGLSTKSRIAVLWTWIILIFLIAAMATSFGRYGPRVMESTESDMTEMTSGLSTDFCTGVVVTSPDTQFDAYILSNKPQINEDTIPYQFRKTVNLTSEKYEYWGYNLLKGSRLKIENCPNDSHRFDMYIIQGEGNFNTWKNNNDNRDVQSHTQHYVTSSCPSFVSYDVFETDEYYIVYANKEHVFGQGTLSATFYLNGTVYDTSNYVQWCKDVKYCDLSYSNQGSDESLVVFVKSAENSDGDATLHTKCKHRSWMFVLVFLLVPIVAGAFFSFMIYIKCRKPLKHNTRPGAASESRPLMSTPKSSSVQSPYPKQQYGPPSYQESMNTWKFSNVIVSKFIVWYIVFSEVFLLYLLKTCVPIKVQPFFF